MQPSFSIEGNIVDILARRIYFGRVHVASGKIGSIEHLASQSDDSNFILPGFIDSHVHIESSMLTPAEFARLAVVHGTIATISDPHEIANVCGLPGVEFMIDNGKKVPFHFFFGAPSCVPATTFETAGAALNATEVALLLQRDEVKYLSEMMNFPGVLHGDEEVLQKIAAAKLANKPVDGHAPGLRGDTAKQYIAAGISTDHECFTAEEAIDKLQYGMKILIREGSAAKNFEALAPLLNEHAANIMFCSDDKHPDSLVDGHINSLCARAVAKGINVFNVLQAACINPALHYKTNTGMLQSGDGANFIVVKDLTHFTVLQTYINGQIVAENGKTKLGSVATEEINHFNCESIEPAHLQTGGNENTDEEFLVIEALDGQLITNKLTLSAASLGNNVVLPSTNHDILKMVVVNRYHQAPIAKAWIKNFGLKEGAIASSVAHDSHNIIAIGCTDEDICDAVNLVIGHRGGISCVGSNKTKVLPLPIAGLMSAKDGYEVAQAYTRIDAMAKTLGSTLSAPFMTLSFMALLVIPHLKLSDKGLFDGDTFTFYNETT